MRVHEELAARGHATLSYPALTAFCRKHGIGHQPAKLAGKYYFKPGQEMQHDTSPHGQIHAIKRRVLPSGKVSFDAERNARGHADKFWVVALACQKERQDARPRGGAIGVRVLG